MTNVERKCRHVVLVGGTRGLGKALAQLLTRDGLQVSVIARGQPDDPVAQATYRNADVTDSSKFEKELTAVVDQHGGLDSLIFLQRYRGDDENRWANELETSLSATKRAIELGATLLSADGARSVVIVGSVYGISVGDGQDVSYQVVKAAIIQLARYYAMTLGPKGIRVNVVSPGAYLKDENRAHKLTDKSYVEMMQRIVPLQRIGTAEEVAEVIAFLCSAKSSLISGQNLVVDGGLSIIWPESAARRALE